MLRFILIALCLAVVSVTSSALPVVGAVTFSGQIVDPAAMEQTVRIVAGTSATQPGLRYSVYEGDNTLLASFDTEQAAAQFAQQRRDYWESKISQ